MPPKKSASRKLNQKEQRNLDIEIGFLEGLIKRDPDYIDALRILGDDYTRRGRYVEGLRVDEHLVRLRPKDPLSFYNLACSYSLTERYDLACAALDQALNLVEETNARGIEPRILEERARLAGLLGDGEACESGLRGAQRRYAEIGAGGHADRLAMELGM